MVAPKLYDPVGRCIYCGTSVYAPDSQRFLGTEHIIPEAISGELELPAASCQRCERLINKHETALLKGVMLGCKTYLGLKTKRPSERPTELPLFDPRESRRTGTVERKVMIPLEDYPISLLLVAFDTPRIFNPIWYDVLLDGGWIHGFTEIKWDVLREKYDLPEFATSSLDTFALCRALAKIAHSYVVAEIGMDSFVPTLPHFILGNYDPLRLHYVGGIVREHAPSNELHEIEIEKPNDEQWQYIVVRIRLFAKFGAPIYRVVAGRRLNPTKPVSILLEEAGVVRKIDRTPFRDPSSTPIPEGLWGPSAPSLHAEPAIKPQRFVRVKCSRPPSGGDRHAGWRINHP